MTVPRVLCALAVVALVCSRATAAPPAFEAASVKPAPPKSRPVMEGGPGTSDPNRIRCRISLRYLVMAAYRTGSSQLSAPAWLDDRLFEITATLPPGTTGAQLRTMLQGLLSERFHLTIHREQKEMVAYTLGIGKGGPKLKEATDQAANTTADDFDPLPSGPPNELELDGEGYPIVPPTEGSWLVALRSGRARTHQFHASMRDLAGLLENQLGRPVADVTGLTGRYEFTLSWMAGDPAPSANVQASDSGPDLPAALKQQLGLSLQSSKESVEVLVIDSIDREPAAN